MARIRVLDFESSSDSPETGGLVEIAYTDVVAADVDLAGNPINWSVVDGNCRRANPGFPIGPETAQIHHIIDEDVAGEQDWKALLRSLVRRGKDEGVIAYAAHSMNFEQKWLHPAWFDGVMPPLVCTYKSALRLWTDAPLHSNMGLRYHRMPVGLDRAKAMPAHSAGPDSYVTAHHLRDMLNDGTPLEQLVAWTKVPALTLRCKMGDYRNGGAGTVWEDVESSMLHWILNKDFDEDIMYTARYHLEKREMDQREEAERHSLNAQLEANGLPIEPLPGDAPAAAPVDERQQELIL